MQTESLKRPREASIRGVAKRGELTPGSPPRPLDRVFLRRLRDTDPSLEMYWHPVRRKWCIYRRPARNVAASDETLVLVSALDRWPGDWVIRKLQSMDSSRRHTTADRGRIADLDMQEMDKQDYEKERRQARELRNLSESLASDARPCFRNRESAHDTKQVVRPKAGRKVIYGPDEQPLRHK